MTSIKGPRNPGRVPQIKRNSDSDRIEAERPQFDYFKMRDDLRRRFVLHAVPSERGMIITQDGVRMVGIVGTDTEIGLVLRDALVNYHLEKARARSEAAQNTRKQKPR